jgi:ABC-type Fe3+/spermidine/putrescine transport system ATPase subunit
MIEVQGIHKGFQGEAVLQGVGFRLSSGKTLSVLGKSGCGKTTLLKVLSGLSSPDSGSFYIDGQDMLALPPERRGVVYLSQEPLLFPHLDVFENIAFGLRIHKTPPAELKSRVEEMLARIGLSTHARKRSDQLSGGQRQRVAFGRAIVVQPRVLLLDEPFGSLDAHTRAEMQALFSDLRAAYASTCLFVTHDLREALALADEIGRMAAGQLEQFADIPAFLHAKDTGIDQELTFWKGIIDIKDGKQGL